MFRKKEIKRVLALMIGSSMGLGLVACGTIELELKNTTPSTTTESITEVETEIENESVTEEKVEETKENDIPQYYFIDNVAVTKDFTIKITNWEIVQAGEGGNKYNDKPAIVFYYDTTNTSGTSISASDAWTYVMDAIQDNSSDYVNKLDVAFYVDDEYSDNSSKEIKKDGTVSSLEAYELSDLETPVKLVATSELFGDEIGSMIYNLKDGTAKNDSEQNIDLQVSDSNDSNIISTENGKMDFRGYTFLLADGFNKDSEDDDQIVFSKDKSMLIYSVANINDTDINEDTYKEEYFGSLIQDGYEEILSSLDGDENYKEVLYVSGKKPQNDEKGGMYGFYMVVFPSENQGVFINMSNTKIESQEELEEFYDNDFVSFQNIVDQFKEDYLE